MTKNRWILGIALAGVLALAGVAVSQTAQPAPSCGGNCQRIGDMPLAMPQPGPMPELTTEQQQKMDDIKVKHLREMLPLRTDLQVKKIELGALWRADELDANKIVSKVREISDLQGKLELARVNQRLAMHKLFTPAQRKQMRMRMGGMGCGRRGMGMGRGMRGMGRGQGMRCPGMMGGGPGMGMGEMGGPGPGCTDCPGQGAPQNPPMTEPE